jgi:hypothetical protein
MAITQNRPVPGTPGSGIWRGMGKDAWERRYP